jgi:FAD/FMN-containing dehydrogenase
MSSYVSDASTLAAAQNLRALMKGKVVTEGEDAYAQLRQIWNGAIERQPALFALCQTVEDVQSAVRIARAHRLPLSVRAGGHDLFGRALTDGGLVIDLTGMRQVEVDPVARVAVLGGGANGTDLSLAAVPHGLAGVTANVGAVGIAGFLLGGGYGPLTTRFGLAADNLLGAEVVLADGQRVKADESQNEDLFWALRGGGGNFGVVTSMRIRLHHVGQLLAGLLVFPWAQAEAVLRGFARIMSMSPDELSMLAVILPLPDGSPGLFLGPIWTGDPEEGKKIVSRLQDLGTPLVNKIEPMSYSELIGIYDSQVQNGRDYYSKTRWLSDLTPEIISLLLKAGSERTSPHSLIALHHFHGAAARVAGEATAFGMRQSHFMVEIVPAWDRASKTEGANHRRWASDLSQRLATFALPGGYPNFLGPDDKEQISSAYGNNARRLREIKQKFDPENVFSSAIPLAG